MFPGNTPSTIALSTAIITPLGGAVTSLCIMLIAEISRHLSVYTGYSVTHTAIDTVLLLQPCACLLAHMH